MDGTAEPASVLLEHRIVEVQLVTNLRDARRGGVLPARDRDGRVTREERHEHERRERHEQEDRDQRQ